MFQDLEITRIIYFWIARVGDDYALSWPNTVLYGCSFIAAVYKWHNLRDAQAPFREQCFWVFVMFVLLVLGVNKQLNFQILFIGLGRYIAENGGWFEERRLIQKLFAYTLSGIAGCGALVVVALIRKQWRHNALALAGMGILCAYTLMRAASISHVGLILQDDSGGQFRLSDLIELVGIVSILINTLIRGGGKWEDDCSC